MVTLATKYTPQLLVYSFVETTEIAAIERTKTIEGIYYTFVILIPTSFVVLRICSRS